jgi:putative transposase
VARGLVGVQLAISDAHPGLKATIARVLGAPWQRCTVHFLRDLRGHCRKDQHDALGALICQLFTAPDGAEARRRLGDAVAQFEGRLPKLAALLEDAEDDVLAFYSFPAEHWPKLRSTNPLERFNREIGRRTDVVGIFPDDPSLIRLVSMLAIEANDCHEGRRCRVSGLSSPRRRLGACENTRFDARRMTCSISASTGAPAARRGAR